MFVIEYMVDFDSKQKNYERRIDIANLNRVFIGVGSENNIVVHSKYLTDDQIELIKSNDGLILSIKKAYLWRLSQWK